MDVVRELQKKQDDLKAERQSLVDQIAQIDDRIAAFDTVIQTYEPDHLPAKKKPRQTGKRGKLADGLFAADNFNALILDALRLAKTPITYQECGIRVALQKGILKDDPRVREIAGRVLIQLSGLEKRNRVEKLEGEGRASLWQIAA